MAISEDRPRTSRWRSVSGIGVPILLFVGAFSLYAATAAPGTLFGDPSEYQFVPALLVIAHPPGYAFYTLLAKLWQILVPVGTIAYRTNLLAAAAGAWTVTAVYLATREIGKAAYAPLLGALCIAAAPDLWQHAIHANAHIVSAALAMTHLWLLARWWRTGRDRWLAAFALVLGLSATHHPITLMGVPAYGLFILLVRLGVLRRWRTLRQAITLGRVPLSLAASLAILAARRLALRWWRTLLVLAGCLLLGLTPLLYFPLRSPHLPPGFQPTDMDTWEGFWRHTTAQGLRVNFFYFGLADQPDRVLVFWSLLRLQFSLPVVLLALVGLAFLVRRAPKAAALLCPFLLVHLLFTMNFYQDTMAYLLGPFACLSILAGLGALALGACVTWLAGRLQSYLARRRGTSGAGRWAPGVCLGLLGVVLLTLPVRQAVLNLQRGISMRDFTAAETYAAAVYGRFGGRGEGAVLLSDWEHLTPLIVHRDVYGEPLDEADVRQVVYVNPTDGPTWVRNVWESAEAGAERIYVVGYRPALRDEGLRLLPDGPFYRVVLPGEVDALPTQSLDVWADGRVHILGYDLFTTTVRAGEPLRLTLYQSVAEPLEGIWMPYAYLGPVEARWTTDSRLLTPRWLPGEVVVEEYELPVPFRLPPGAYPLRLGYADLLGERPELPLSTGGTTVELAIVTVLPSDAAAPLGVLEGALANLDNQVALLGARVEAGGPVRRALWQEPLVVRPGQPIHLVLTWRALAPPRDSYKVFIHLMDGANHPVLSHDNTPLGGAFPTYLWFPKWLPGQTVDDPYRLVVPPDLAPGDYYLEVGMYGMTSHRRLPVVNLAGSLAGDRVILGPVRVE